MQELNMNLIIAFNEHFFVYFTLAILRELRVINKGKVVGSTQNFSCPITASMQ